MTVRAESVMGTVVSFDLRDDGVPDAALDDAIRWLHEVDARFSPYRPDSEVSRLADGTLEAASAHPDVQEVLGLVDAAARDSAGAFDARRWRDDGRFDPSGLVKGWAVQRAADGLRNAGGHAFAIAAGGDIVTAGGPRPGAPWRVGVRHPDRPDRVAVVLAIADLAVATSAAYERGAHIRDPRSGRTADGVRSMTVVGPDLTWVDTFATAAYVMGLDGLTWVAGHAGYDALAVTWDDGVVWTSGMDRYLIR